MVKHTDLINDNTAEWLVSKTAESGLKEATTTCAQSAADHMSVKQKARLHRLFFIPKLKTEYFIIIKQM